MNPLLLTSLPEIKEETLKNVRCVLPNDTEVATGGKSTFRPAAINPR